MLKLDIPDIEVFVEETNEFMSIKSTTIKLEHSLISLANWEKKWHKPFLSKLKQHEKTNEEMLDYIRCMCVTQNVDPLVFKYMPEACIEKINEYIQDPMTATWFPKQGPNKPSGEIPTAELIYYWMIKMGIPIEFQKWHLNRLMTLIEVFSVKDAPPKKMSRPEMAKQRDALNRARLAKYHTKG